jgi:hypothetical protein
VAGEKGRDLRPHRTGAQHDSFVDCLGHAIRIDQIGRRA